MRSSIVLTIPAGSDGSTFAQCDGGDLAVGGGFDSTNDVGSLDVYEARPIGGEDGEGMPSSFFVRAVNDTASTHELEVYVVCLDLAS